MSPVMHDDTRYIDPSQFPSDDHRHELTEGLPIEGTAEEWYVYRCIFCTFELRCWEAS